MAGPFNFSMLQQQPTQMKDPESVLKMLPHARRMIDEMEAMGVPLPDPKIRDKIDWMEKSLKDFLAMGKAP